MAGAFSFGFLSLYAVQNAWAAGSLGQVTGEGNGGVPSPIGNNSMAAASPMTDYTVRAIVYVMIIGVLIAVMMIGAFLVLNVGLMSKRDRDRTGGRNPSDVGLLKNSNWPQVPEEKHVLPAAEGEEGQDEHGDLDTRRPGAA